jgi:hypothetical protein
MDRDGKLLINRSRPDDINGIEVLVASRVDSVRAARGRVRD